jgi:HTH-type transcriptional regulator/antitoxin HigA
MYLRGWFEEFTGSLDEAIKNADILAHDFILTAPKKPVFEFFHKSIRSDLHSDEFALFVWEIRVLTLATRVKLSNKYLDQSLDSAWLSSLIKASSKEDGPIRIKAMLQEIGIPLIIEPHLTNTYLDGAALLGTESPVIGMTLRYDRLDNFWFVLFHEVSHIMMHLRKGKLETIFDDLDGKSRNRIEQEADLMAEDAMIPNEKWKEALPRYVRSPESIKDYAAELDINPAIIAGRIRYESNNYRILNDLIGQGMVRKNFPNIIFGA